MKITSKKILKKTSINFDVNLLKELKKIAFENGTTQTEVIHQFLIEGIARKNNKIKGNAMELITIDEELMEKITLMSNQKKQNPGELVNNYINQGLEDDGINKIYRKKITTDDIIGIIDDNGEEWDIDSEVYE